jgi:hypothetical protein
MPPLRFGGAIAIRLNMDYLPSTGRSWRISEFVCALSDAARHLGHLIMIEKWHAYDATQSNEASNGFKYLGTFVELADAKQAVELSVTGVRRQGALGAGGGSN